MKSEQISSLPMPTVRAITDEQRSQFTRDMMSALTSITEVYKMPGHAEQGS